MGPEDGLTYGLLFSAVLLVSLFWFFTWREHRTLRRRREKYPRRPGEAARLRARMARMAQPTLLLTPTDSPGFPKIGGAPELPVGLGWPQGMKHARVFLAQIDLHSFQPYLPVRWLPEAGRLYAFYDPERGGFADEVILLFSTGALEGADPFHADARPFPDDLPARLRFPERRVGFTQVTSIPSLDWLGVDVAELGLSSHDLDDLAEAPDEPFGDEIQHRIGGYPSEIQDDQMHVSCEFTRRGLKRDWDQDVPPAILRAARDWRMILQIDSDEALGMNWFDGGRFYVFGRVQDLAKGDFSKTVTISQSH